MERLERRVKCPHCGYAWLRHGTRARTTCTNCARVFVDHASPALAALRRKEKRHGDE